MAELLSYISLPFLPVDVSWPLPNFNRPHKVWAISRAIVIPTIGMCSRFMAHWLNTMTVYNRDILINALDNRPATRPLITVSNHYSCLDDPVLWGILDIRHLFQARRMRWSLAANDICFTNELHALFFSLGQTIPLVRGHGVYQKAMDFALERLNKGEWVHIFPEGKINANKELLRYKWGVGRLVAECRHNPIVIPMFHLGMDDVLPNESPYVPQFGKKITVVVGNPIDLDEALVELNNGNQSAREKRKAITDIIQDEMWKLRDVAEILHRSTEKKVQ